MRTVGGPKPQKIGGDCCGGEPPSVADTADAVVVPLTYVDGTQIPVSVRAKQSGYFDLGGILQRSSTAWIRGAQKSI